MLSSRAKYATRALLELSLRHDEEAVHLTAVAEAQEIPLPFLQQIMGTLRLGGFVISRKGPGGGFKLSRHPRDITLGEVVRAIDGPIALISCVSVTRHADCGCPEPQSCGLRLAFKAARDAMAEVLDNTTYEDIVEHHRDGASRQHMDFMI